ncbi:MAG TPA: protein kinase [Polyangiales bacterium]|nr:protein kinase [Polyangiales bacterium]
MTSIPEDQAAPPLSARYELRGEVARGAMGTIHCAYDRLRGTEVAYKRLRVENEGRRARMLVLFQREYETLVRLEHPRIVQAYEYGHDAFGPYYTMELLSGTDLAKVGARPWQEVLQILRDVASALALIHARHLVHRDVSANNVRLSADGRAKLIDFGALLPFGPSDQVVGTPAFVSPEAMRGEPLDGRTDLYALGALGYWLITSALAVRARSLDELPYALEYDILPPSSRVEDVPEAVDQLLLALLQREAVARPPDAAALIARIDQILPGLDVDDAAYAASFLQHPNLVGREEPKRAAIGLLEKVRVGTGAVMTLQGPAGSGRTALLDDLAIEARLRGFTILRTSGHVQLGPFAAAVQLIETGLFSYPDVARKNPTSGSWRRPADASGEDPMRAAERHARAAEQLASALQQLALRAPLVLIVDDSELVDRLTLAWLATVARAPLEYPLALFLSRSDEAPASSAQESLSASGPVRTLAPLSLEHTRQLVAALFGDVENAGRLATWMHEQCGGNAADCFALLRSLLQEGRVRYRQGSFVIPFTFEAHGGSVPWGALARLAGLSPTERTLVDVLSLHEGGLAAEELAQVAGVELPALMPALSKLDARGMTVRAADRHALGSASLRSAAREALDLRTGSAIHRELAGVLIARGPADVFDALAAGLHLIHAQGASALKGAQLIVDASRRQRYELALSAAATPYYEAALAVFEQHGRRDRELFDLLVPLSVAGFYGELAVQRRYIQRTMNALAEDSGIASAAKLQRWLGQRLGLVLGIAGALLRHLLRIRARTQRTVPENVSALLQVAATTLAATGSAADFEESQRIVTWLAPLSGSRILAVQLGRDFCRATAFAVCGRFVSATELYSSLLQRLAQPVAGMNEHVREQLRLGCFHGRGECALQMSVGDPLKDADELDESAFLAPHAEVIRAVHYAHHGDVESARAHRTRAETLAFRGGVSWSAMALLGTQMMHASVLSEDELGLRQAVATLERFADLSRGMQLHVEVGRAALLRHAGRGERALPIWERIVTPENSDYSGYGEVHAWYARQVRELGDAARAKEICERGLASVPAEERDVTTAHQLLCQQLALCEAALGNLARGRQLLEQLRALLEPLANPLRLGLLERDLADVACLDEDRELFRQHFDAVEERCRSTRNPALFWIRDALATRATRAGMYVPGFHAPVVALDEDDGLDGSTEAGDTLQAAKRP